MTSAPVATRRPESTQPAPPQGPADKRTLSLPSWRGLMATGIMVAFLAAAIWSIIDLRINIATLIDSWDNAVRLFNKVLPLDFPSWAELWEMTALTLAIFFIRVFGFGSMAGILALSLASIGMVGKLYADAIEDADDGPRMALEENGATRIQQIFGATIPAVMPAIVATGLHRFDINLRASVILGVVGAGGIGFFLLNANRVLQFEAVTFILVLIIAVVLALEAINIVR